MLIFLMVTILIANIPVIHLVSLHVQVFANRVEHAYKSRPWCFL